MSCLLDVSHNTAHCTGRWLYVLSPGQGGQSQHHTLYGEVVVCPVSWTISSLYCCYGGMDKEDDIVCCGCLQQERMDIEERYSTLQEEVAGKTKKLKKVWTMLMQAKSEVSGCCTL